MIVNAARWSVKGKALSDALNVRQKLVTISPEAVFLNTVDSTREVITLTVSTVRMFELFYQLLTESIYST